MQLQMEMEDQENGSCGMGGIRRRTSVVGTQLLGPEDSEVDLRYVLRYARKKKGRKIFENCSSKGQSEFLVVGRALKGAGNTGGRIKREGTGSGL